MPWTRQQVKYLLSDGSPLSAEQKAKMQAELHTDPSLGHKKKGLTVRAAERDNDRSERNG